MLDWLHFRLDDDERLDKLLDQLEKKLPAPDRQQQQVSEARPTVSKRSAGVPARAQQVKSASRGRKPGGLAAAAKMGLRNRSSGRDQRGAVAEIGDGSAAQDSDDADVLESEYGSSTVTGDGSSTISVKSGLAAELRAVRQQLEDLEDRAGNKARRALGNLPAAATRFAATG